MSAKKNINLQSAFDATYAAGAEVKKFAGLNDDVSIAKIETEADVNYVQTGQKPFSAKQADAYRRPKYRQYNQGKPKGPCYKCDQYGLLHTNAQREGQAHL